MATERATWIFQANPQLFDLEAAVRQLSELSWLVNQHAEAIQQGDLVYLWVSGEEGGLVAVATVLTEPADLAPAAEERRFMLDPERFEAARRRVRLDVHAALDDPIHRDHLRADPALSTMRFLDFAQGTNFEVSKAEAIALQGLIAAQGTTEFVCNTADGLAFHLREFLRQATGKGEWQRHLESYTQSRDQARRYYEEIGAAEQRGEDVTDRVLLHLLPHQDTPHNREKGAWTHVAPAVTRDLKSWFENAGWVRPEDWPHVAKAILAFVRRCVERPDELEAACQEFSSNSASRGIQSGFLSPILNALRPDRFVIINNKSRRVYNYFSRESYGYGLLDYPALNATAYTLMAALAPLDAWGDVPEERRGDYFDMYGHWATAEQGFDFEPREARIWKVSPGEGAWQWEACRDGGFIAMGWNDFGDLSNATYQDFKKRQGRLLKQFKDWTERGTNQVWRFRQIQPGDRIVANRGTEAVLGIGTVVGPYYFAKDEDQGHRLTVHWDDLTTRPVQMPGWRRTLMPMDRETFQAIQSLDGEPRPPREPEPPMLEAAAYPLERLAEDTRLDLETLTRWVAAIERKGQVVLYGPPGTGKTFVAEHLARHLVEGRDGFIDTVQFHPAYAYEDFMQGIRPQTESGALSYPMVPGRFLAFCDEARRRQGPCVLIIDELNRANLARVFGELMYLLEYRSREMPLAGGGRFSIPENVRLIGTMNTADRSISLVDHALRRRFAFLPLYPEYDILRSYQRDAGWEVGGLVDVLRELNRQIGDRHYEVGISFFMRSDLARELEDIWRMEIEPYLEEYFFDRPERLEPFRWSRIAAKATPSCQPSPLSS